ncbi:hypothetical protein PGSY75_1122300 [Plasmodium gaboni]|uniref:Uncharacterized protein n=1 Tax=Plasmodium gaboni TaxID=647221 RepID=A0A151LIV7_9APIC|nr:hypothetical protein PGSY75_1122300 [Plasmodium gaboni]KYN98864.1 hypothetical protein PGSY75_1122300 [Plasmodium gaboni]SOV15640.1 conserved Plasmodium protein, unknown function [Plasmodium gaboni]SOV23300.1 conserved Plasmodium protein, unknown function [Plasmodium sp. DRC-Itaito]
MTPVTFECISVALVSLFFIKILAYIYKQKCEKDHSKVNKGKENKNSTMNVKVDIVCDITNSFGKYYAKEVLKKKNLLGIIPVYKSYNKEYENVDKFNGFMAEFFKFLDLKNGKVILASDNNCINNYINPISKIEDTENENDEEDILLASCIIYEKILIIVCVINYDMDIEKQLDYFLKNQKNDLLIVINNLFLNSNLKDEKNYKNMELLEKKCSLLPKGDVNNLLSFLDFMNIQKGCINDLYSIIQINMKNFQYFYKLLGNTTSGTFLNGHVYDNFMSTNLYNSLMDIYHDLISETIKKDKKKINIKKFYTFYCVKCDYKKIVKLSLMKLENNFFLFYIYNIYSYIYYQLILYVSSQKNSV